MIGTSPSARAQQRQANLERELAARAAEGRPVRVALVGAGKFGCMFLAQAARTSGLHVAVVVDLDVARARKSLQRIGWQPQRYAAATISEALANHTTLVSDDFDMVVQCEEIGVVVEATGNVTAAIDHALRTFSAAKHLVMVTVEADALVGPALAGRARSAGVVYSMAYGDQPALICELVDWARACGFTVTCAGKGTKYLPTYHQSTPDTVWGHYGFTTEQVASGDYNARMFNSFLDGTKSAIEMAAVANACGLAPQAGGLRFPPCGATDLASVCRPRAHGGMLDHSGTVEVVSSLERDGRPVQQDLRWGVYVTFETDNPYVQRCFAEYGVVTDDSGRYAALYRPTHFIGLELGYSVARAGVWGEPTGTPDRFLADVVAVAKRDLQPGEFLDGEGGYTVYGQLLPAERSLEQKLLPIGLAHGCRLVRPVAAGQALRAEDVPRAEQDPIAALRRETAAARR